MKKTILLSLIIVFNTFFLKVISQPCSLSGTFSIGPSGSYSSITQALDSLRSHGMGGPVILELTPTYSAASVESFPLSFGGIPCISAVNNLSIRPQAQAGVIYIISNNNGPTVNFSNARYINIDGRPNGSSNTIGLKFKNSNPNGTVFSFSNDASFNTITYLGINGIRNVEFLGSTSNITSGNNNNTISFCNIGDSTQAVFYGVYSVGGAGKKNTQNKIIGCNICNVNGGSTIQVEAGVYLAANNAQWEISGNSFYQTFPSSSNITGIFIDDITSSGFLIENNYVGGTAPICGGSPLVYSGFYTGIATSTSNTSSFTIIKNNTISNIECRSQSIFSGIQLFKGKVDCNNNNIGSQTKRSSISSTSPCLSNSYTNGINITLPLSQSSADSFLIRNNKIGGFILKRDPSNYLESYFNGINVTILTKSYVEVSGNILGSATTQNSVESVVQEEILKGINIEVGDTVSGDINKPNPLKYYITNNTINNFHGKITAISVIGGIATIANNTITNLSNASINGTFNISTAICGIQITKPLSGTLVQANQIHGFTGEISNTRIVGILATYTGGIKIEKNFIHSFNSISAGYLAGVLVDNYSSTISGSGIEIYNNMVSLGNDSSNVSKDYYMYGISAPLNNVTISNNSVSIAGAGPADITTTALNITDGSTSTNRIVNNIFQNKKINTSPSLSFGSVISFESGLQGPSAFLINNNVYYFNQQGINVADFKGSKYSSLKDWRNFSKQDSNTVFYNPNFINSNRGETSINLHLANPTPAEGQGIFEPLVTEDYDGDSRNNFTPVDIGADAGNFIFRDGEAPVITQSAFLFQPLSSVSTIKVKITDNGTGVDTSGLNKPRMWFKKSYPVPGSWQSVAGNLTTGSIKNGEWTFVPDFAAANLNLKAGDSIAYYFVAQDQGTFFNIAYSIQDSTKHSSVANQLIPPVNPPRSFVYGLFPDTIYVGSGQLFTSLTNDSGFFQASKKYQFNLLTDTAHIIITSDLSEKGIFDFNMFSGPGGVIKFHTNTPFLKLVKNSGDLYSNPMIRFLNTYNVFIDGSIDGSGRYLQFINKRTILPENSTSVIATLGITNNFSLKNCIFTSNSTKAVNVDFGGIPSGNFLIAGNFFSNIPDSKILPVQHLRIYCPDSLLVADNEFLNFNGGGIYVFTSSIKSTKKLIISSNHFYYKNLKYVTSPVNYNKAIRINSSRAVTVINNYIGGTEKFCGGEPWKQEYLPNDYASTNDFTGIEYTGSYLYSQRGSIQNNTIRNIRLLNGSTSSFTGISLLDGNFDLGTKLANNIGQTGDTSILCYGVTKGIVANSSGTNQARASLKIYNSNIAGILGGYLTGMDIKSDTVELVNNKLNNCISQFGCTGFKLTLGKGLIEKNLIYDLLSNTFYNSSSDCLGIDIVSSGTVKVNANKIYNLKMPGTKLLAGIRVDAQNSYISNNQLNISNYSGTNSSSLTGLYIKGSLSNTLYKTNINYNSIRIFGNAVGNSINSYTVYVEGSSSVASFKNNLLYNQRYGGGAKHLALKIASTLTNPQIWLPSSSNNNLYITADTSYVNEWKDKGATSLKKWQTFSQSDFNSYSETIQTVPADSLFIANANSNLNINNFSPFCWYVNNKARPIAEISGDFDTLAGVRSIDTTNGKSDIGSDEFNTNTIQPPTAISYCSGSSSVISSNISGSTYQWQLDAGNGFNNILDDNNYSGTYTPNLMLITPLSSWYGYQFRCQVSGQLSNVFSIEFVNQWLGTASSEWGNPANWSCGMVPDGNTDVRISSGSVVLNSNGICRSITVNAGASFSVLNGALLTITHQ